jgi:N-acetylglucosaminyl-diphospho-decaprenol L-rhamnosyltransferase
MPIVSIIIVTYDSFNEIGRCIESICKQTGSVDLETIVVDNFSIDLTVDVVKKNNRVILIQNPTNLGYAAAVNRGFAESKGNFILVLNPDTVLHEGFLSKLSKILEENSQQRIIGFKLTDENGEYQQSAWNTPKLLSLFYEMFLPYKFYIRLTSINPEKACEVQSVSGACMFIHREVFNKIGGFDERFFMYYEDTDFCLRAREAGIAVRYHPEVSIIHLHGKSAWKNWKDFYYNYFYSKFKFFQKHFTGLKYLIACSIIIVGLMFRSIAYFVSGILVFKKQLITLSKYHIFILSKVFNMIQK